jgi:hypothetical protein
MSVHLTDTAGNFDAVHLGEGDFKEYQIHFKGIVMQQLVAVVVG